MVSSPQNLVFMCSVPPDVRARHAAYVAAAEERRDAAKAAKEAKAAQDSRRRLENNHEGAKRISAYDLDEFLRKKAERNARRHALGMNLRSHDDPITAKFVRHTNTIYGNVPTRARKRLQLKFGDDQVGYENALLIERARRQLKTGNRKDFLNRPDSKLEGLYDKYVSLPEHKVFAEIVDIDRDWRVDELVFALHHLVEIGKIDCMPHHVVGEIVDGVIRRPHVYWYLPDESWVWLDSADPRFHSAPVELHRAVNRALKAALAELGADQGSSELKRVKAPTSESWSVLITNVTRFPSLDDWASVLPLDRAPSVRRRAKVRQAVALGLASAACVSQPVFEVAGDITLRVIRDLHFAEDMTYLRLLVDRPKLTEYVIGMVMPEVLAAVEVSGPAHRARAKFSEIERAVRERATFICQKWWDPKKASNRVRGQYVERTAVAETATEARRISATITTETVAARNDFFGKIVRCIGALRRTFDGRWPIAAEVRRETGIAKTTVYRLWGAALAEARRVDRAIQARVGRLLSEASAVAVAATEDSAKTFGIVEFAEDSRSVPRSPEETSTVEPRTHFSCDDGGAEWTDIEVYHPTLGVDPDAIPAESLADRLSRRILQLFPGSILISDRPDMSVLCDGTSPPAERIPW